MSTSPAGAPTRAKGPSPNASTSGFGWAGAVTATGCMAMYQESTRSIQISVEPFYLDDQSTPEQRRFVFGYRVQIDNQGGEDRLVGMASGAAGAIGVMGDAGVGGHTAEIAEVDMAVPTGETTFAPGERHIMLEDLAAPLEPGDSFDLTLEFEDHGEETVAVEVLSWDDAVERYEAG